MVENKEIEEDRYRKEEGTRRGRGSSIYYGRRKRIYKNIIIMN